MDDTNRRVGATRSTLRAVFMRKLAMEPYPERLHHKTPGWVKSGAMFHVRIRMAEGTTLKAEAHFQADALLAAAQRYHDTGK